jgi:hypothetical protein
MPKFIVEGTQSGKRCIGEFEAQNLREAEKMFHQLYPEALLKVDTESRPFREQSSFSHEGEDREL